MAGAPGALPAPGTAGRRLCAARPLGRPGRRGRHGSLLAAAHAQARRRRAIFLKVEPPLADGAAAADLLRAHGFRPSAQRVQPLSTIVVDLTRRPGGDQRALQAQVALQRRAGRAQGSVVRQGGLEDVPAWYRLMEVTGTARRLRHPLRRRTTATSSPDGAKGAAAAGGARGELLAGIAVTAFGAQAIYMYGASCDEQRNLMPNHLLQWEAMQWARGRLPGVRPVGHPRRGGQGSGRDNRGGAVPGPGRGPGRRLPLQVGLRRTGRRAPWGPGTTSTRRRSTGCTAPPCPGTGG